MPTVPWSREIRLGLPVLLVMTLAACGGGGGGGGGASSSGGGTSSSGGTPAVTYSLSGTVSGLSAGTVVLAVTGKPDVSVSTNGNAALASGLASGATYTVSVKTQPAGLTCQLSHETGTMPAADVADVQVSCGPAIALTIDAPADNLLVPVDAPLDITFTIANTTYPRLNWAWSPQSTSTLAAGGANGNTGQMRFQASAPGNYTITVSSLDDKSKSATLHLRVHVVYAAMDAYVQDRVYLRADGRAVGATFNDLADAVGVPTASFTAVAQGYDARYGLKADGTVLAWGTRLDQPGANDTPQSPPTGLSHVSKIAASHHYAAALKDDGTIVVWGRGSGMDALIPASLAANHYVAMDVGAATFAGIKDDGTLAIWHGAFQTIYTPPAAWSGKTFTKLCQTKWHIVAVDSTGAVMTWNPVNTGDPEMDTVPATTAPVTAVYCGSDHAALVQQDGRVKMWGASLPAGGFDSSTVSGWPHIKGASLVDFQAPRFLTDGGAIIDVTGNVVTAIDAL